MPVAEKYLTFVAAMLGNIGVAWAINNGLKSHGADTKSGLQSLGTGAKEGLASHMTVEGAGKQHLEIGLEKLGKELGKAKRF